MSELALLEQDALGVSFEVDGWQTVEGNPFPLGVTFDQASQVYNFAIYSKYATRVDLLIYGEDNLVEPIWQESLNPYRNKSYRVWHCRVAKEEIAGGAFYAYRMWGPDSAPNFQFQAFDPQKILLDPYAKGVHFPKEFDRGSAIVGAGPNDGKAPLGILNPEPEPFDWQGVTPPRHGHDLVIYETHVKQYTSNANSKVGAGNEGTFQGIIDKIPYLKSLGITAVELMPIHQWDPQEGSQWGYMTLNFFSPHEQYASSKEIGGAIKEFKTLVRELHRNDIEVILDVVFNHTTEGNQNGPLYSFKGIDNSSYYMSNEGTDAKYYYSNYSGCGNTVHCSNKAVRKMVVESLSYWVKEMHVDGFRFDIASIFARNSDGSFNLQDPAIFAEISMDPVLRDIILIAEPWEPYANLLGRSFPGLRWRQWNARYRDDVKSFGKGDPSLVGAMVTRIYGSDDLFPGDPYNANRGYQSLNYLASHDGLTLYDCFSYSNDGRVADHNKSWNCGYEGVENVPSDVMSLRKRLMKNEFAILMVSNGTPMFRAGDEFLQTQYGNDNPYNVDDHTTWMDWSRVDEFPDMFRFFKEMIAFRKRHPSIGRSRFWREDVKWFGPRGSIDYSPLSRTLAFYLKGNNPYYGLNDKDIYVMINSYWGAVQFEFQEQGEWSRVINTELPSPHDVLPEGQEIITDNSYLLGPRSMAVFVK